jgi:hypothetical protein
MQRWVRILMLGWLGVWFGVIAPGHQRGIVMLPGTVKPGSCCVVRGELVVNKGGQAPAKQTPPMPVKGCAICQINATLATPEVIVFHALDLGLVQLLPLPPPVAAPVLALLHVDYSRGPPVMC